MDESSRKRRPQERLLPAVAAGVGAAVLTAGLLLAGVVPALAGARPVAITIATPEEALAPGALAVVRPDPPAAGDVVALVPDSGGVRRLAVVEAVGPSGATLVTSDDGAPVVVPVAAVEGVYLYGVPWLGAVWSVLSTPSGMFFLAASLLLLVAAQQVRATRRGRTAV